MTITAKAAQAIKDIEETLNECAAQRTQLEAYAFLGAYSKAVFDNVYVKKNLPDQKDLIEKLTELTEFANHTPKSNEYEFSMENYSNILEECGNKTDRVSGFAYSFAYNKIAESVAYVKLSKPEDKALLSSVTAHFKGFKRNRADNVSSTFQP